MTPLVLKNAEVLSDVIAAHQIPPSMVINLDETCSRPLGNLMVKHQRFVVPAGVHSVRLPC